MSSARPVVLVIGGGLGGLASAIPLQRSGYDARVLEAAPDAIGSVSSVRTRAGHVIFTYDEP